MRLSRRLIEQLILGVRHAKIQDKLLGRDDTPTLDAAMDVVKTHEATVSNMQQFTGESNVSHVSRIGKNGSHVTRVNIMMANKIVEIVDAVTT